MPRDKVKRVISIKNYYFRMRAAVIEALGSVCVRCGFSDKRALQIDHINGGGLKEFKETNARGASYHRKVILSIVAQENKYQLLCANCNWIKKSENKENRTFNKLKA